MVRARKLKFLENVHPPPCVTCQVSHVTWQVSHVTCQVSHVRCHMSGVTCQVSRVRCHMSYIYIFFLQSDWASRWRVCYQRGLPRLVFNRPWILRECSPPNKCHMSGVRCHMSGVRCHVSHVTCHMSHVTCHLSRVTCHMSHVKKIFFYILNFF